MNNRIKNLSRALLTVCGLALLAVLITPLWQIDLMAPQYPEGLRLLIYADKLAGNVDIINGLNHYIGMKTLHTEDFAEFKILPGIIIAFSVLFILAGIFGRRKWMNALFILFVAFGILAMVDFWRWEYDYGHNLDPNAAIIVPGMAYQPPLIGFKQLLNFGAYSIPATGGWIFVGVGIVLMTLVIYEWRIRKAARIASRTAVVAASLFLILLTGCSTNPQPLRLGKDNCDFCKMTISDKRFGAELITKKGKVYKFDDGHCLLAFMQSKKVAKIDMAAVYYSNFIGNNELLNAEKAFFLQSPQLKSPMNGNIAAFAHEDSLHAWLPKYYGNKISWEEMQK